MKAADRFSPKGSDPLWPAEVVSEERPGIRELADTRRFAIADVDGVLPGSIVAARGKTGEDRAEIERILAPPGSRADLYRLISRHGINPFYDEKAHREVDQWLDDPHIDDPRLEDLEDLPFVTIDNEDSRDLDQAIFIRRRDDSGEGFEIFYALADAAFYVPVESALLGEALQRGSSYYLPTFSVPMLPRGLSEGLVSLNPKVFRRALDKESLLLALDQLFAEELQKDDSQRRLFSATLIGMKSHLLYFLLDEPRIEVKVHLKDLEEMSDTKWRSDGIGSEALPFEGPIRSPMRVGDLYRLRVDGFDNKRRYWLLKPRLGSSDDLESRYTCPTERS